MTVSHQSPLPTRVSFGLGTASLGNLYREVDDTTSAEVVDTAWTAGVRYFDTAPHYGLGLSERRIGTSLRTRPRSEFLLSTKVGRILDPVETTRGTLDDEGFVVPATHRRRWDFSADGVTRSLAASLERLGLDRVDILYLHDPEDHLEQAVAEALPALVSLRDQGVVGAIGVGSKSVPAMVRLAETGMLDLVMVAGRYTLLEQPALDSLFPVIERSGSRVVAVGVFNSGLLSTSTPDAAAKYEYGTVPPAVLDRARTLARICGDHGVELPHAAVQFALVHPLVTNVTLGVGRPHHIGSNAEWSNTPIASALWRELEAEGLIPPGVTPA